MLRSTVMNRTTAATVTIAIVCALTACSGVQDPEPVEVAAPGDSTTDDAPAQSADPIAMITIGSESYEATPTCVTGDYLSMRGIQAGGTPSIVIFASFGIDDEADIVTLVVSGFDDMGTQDTWSVTSGDSTDAAVGIFGGYAFDVDAGTASGEADFQFTRVTPGTSSSEERLDSGVFEFRC